MIRDKDGNEYFIFDSHSHMGPRPFRSATTAMAELPVSQKLAEMDAAGVDMAVVFPRANPHTDYREGNEAVIRAMEQYPTRFVAYAWMHPYFKAKAVADIAEYADRGIRGIKLHPLRDFSGNAVNDRAVIFPLIEEAAKHNLLVLIHSGHSWNSIPHLIGDLAKNFPETKFIIAHCGSREHVDAVLVGKEQPNIYLDSAEVFPPHVVTLAARGLGADRVLYGSDHPAMPDAMEIGKVVKYCDFTPEELHLILGQNLLKLLSIKPDTSNRPIIDLANI